MFFIINLICCSQTLNGLEQGLVKKRPIGFQWLRNIKNKYIHFGIRHIFFK